MTGKLNSNLYYTTDSNYGLQFMLKDSASYYYDFDLTGRNSVSVIINGTTILLTKYKIVATPPSTRN
jgi:hypothetical protein